MKRSAGGFTLIELIIVVVILGILAATAMPRFFDVKDDALQAAVDGVAGGLSSASSINYAGKMANKTVTPTSLSGAAAGAVCDSGTGSDKLGDLLSGGWPGTGTEYTVAAKTGTSKTCSANGSNECTLTLTKSGSNKTANFNVTCY